MKEEEQWIKILSSTQSLEELSTELKQSEPKNLNQSEGPYFYLNHIKKQKFFEEIFIF